ncbi:MAG: isochorismatase family protein [Burkholderiales bacterium]|nr:isochorismatase family protein [Burkholderiales bacterium]
MTELDPTRRTFMTNVAGVAATAGGIAAALSSSTAEAAEDKKKLGGVHAIPELAPQWKSLDLAEILKRPAAFLSISAVKSLYEPWGAQASERQWERGSLEAAVKVAKEARKHDNFKTFAWIGYEVFRQNYPQSDFDRAQYATWTKGIEDWPLEKQAKDNEIATPLAELIKPGDLEFSELALQTAFVGTQLPLDLARKRVQVIVLTGIHLDWCIEGNARAARDNGYLPIVIGDACGCQKPEQEAAAMERINNFFAPVISADTFVKLLNA